MRISGQGLHRIAFNLNHEGFRLDAQIRTIFKGIELPLCRLHRRDLVRKGDVHP